MELAEAGLSVLATTGGADANIDLDKATDDGILDLPTAWLFGSEAHGLPAKVHCACPHPNPHPRGDGSLAGLRPQSSKGAVTLAFMADFAQRAAEKGASMKKSVMDAGCKALDHSESFVKKNPKSTVASAFGIGALIGGAIVFLMLSRQE